MQAETALRRFFATSEPKQCGQLCSQSPSHVNNAKKKVAKRIYTPLNPISTEHWGRDSQTAMCGCIHCSALSHGG